MANYHINPETGDPGVCRARTKCPFGDIQIDHFTSKKEARDYYELEQNLLEQVKQVKVNLKQHPITKQALSSTLVHNGPEPEWLHELQETGLKKFGNKTEIIDIIETSQGSLAVTWSPSSVDEIDESMQLEGGRECHELNYRKIDDGTILGKLKVSYLTPETITRSFGDNEWTGLRYCDEIKGKLTGATSIERNNEDKYVRVDNFAKVTTPDELIALKKTIWAQSHASFNITPKNVSMKELHGLLVNLTPEMAPNDPVKLDEDLKILQNHANTELNEDMKELKAPFIKYSGLDETLRGQGLGTSLYIYAARKMSEKGLTLEGSGTQTEYAQKAWVRMAADETIPTKLGKRLYFEKGVLVKRTPNFVIDFGTEA